MHISCKYRLMILFLFAQSFGGLNLVKDDCRSQMWMNAYNSAPGVPYHYHSYSISPSNKWVLEIGYYYGSSQNYVDSVPIYIFQYCYPPEHIYITTVLPSVANKGVGVEFGGHQFSNGLFQSTWNISEDTAYFFIGNSIVNTKNDTNEIFYVDVSSITRNITNSIQLKSSPSLLKLNNRPNPFNSGTVIEYSIPDDGYVAINIYNSKGELVIVLGQKAESKGNHSIKWNGKNNLGENVSNGTYYYQIIFGNNISVRKMILLK